MALKKLAKKLVHFGTSLSLMIRMFRSLFRMFREVLRTLNYPLITLFRHVAYCSVVFRMLFRYTRSWQLAAYKRRLTWCHIFILDLDTSTPGRPVPSLVYIHQDVCCCPPYYPDGGHGRRDDPGGRPGG